MLLDENTIFKNYGTFSTKENEQSFKDNAERRMTYAEQLRLTGGSVWNGVVGASKWVKDSSMSVVNSIDDVFEQIAENGGSTSSYYEIK